jgi:protocatechuate 3,4-dioxygenase beta subunit
MLRHNLKVIALTALFLGAAAATTGFLTRAVAMRDEPKDPTLIPPPQAATNREPAAARPAPGRMLVTGRVLDSHGEPVPNATVMVHADTKLHGRILGPEVGPVPIGRARNDSSGRFQIDALRTTSASHHVVSAVAVAPGYGAGWVVLDADAEEPTADITLRPEQMIHGRLFDVQGRPAREVTVTVQALFRVARESPGFRGEPEGQAFWMTHAKDLMGWPQPSTTDAEGRFTLRGVDRGTQVYLLVDASRFARQLIDIDTDTLSDSRPLRLALQPSQFITGRVTYADNGKPVPKAWIEVKSLNKAEGGTRGSRFQADAEGRFRAKPFPGDRFYVVAHSPDRQPYLSIQKTFDWPKGALEHSIDLALPRGVPIRGKVTEEGSGQPIGGAAVTYIVASNVDASPDSWSSPAETGADGSFEFGVLTQPGYLVIGAPSEDYLTQEIGWRLLFEGQPGGWRVYGHAFIACDPKPGGAGAKFNITLRRGVVIKGRVIGPDGQPVHDAWMFSRVILGPSTSAWRSWNAYNRGHARDGRFELHGIDPGAGALVYFLEPNRKLGATARLPGTSAGGPPVIVRLEACGAARARLVNGDGKPIAVRLRPEFITMVVTAAPLVGAAQVNSGQLFADGGILSNVDPINHANPLVSDAEGRVEIPVLIPGATYRLIDRTAVRAPGDAQVRKEFSVKPGATLDLGDIRIEKPQRMLIR